GGAGGWGSQGSEGGAAHGETAGQARAACSSGAWHARGDMSFQQDGQATLDWVAGYLERVRELPVMARVEPGEIRRGLPAAPPDEPEPFAAVLRDLEEVLLPGITHWQSPRFFGYFPNTATEAGILAELLSAA